MWYGCAMVNSQYPNRIAAGDMFRYSVDAIVALGFSTTMSYANQGYDQDYDGETGFTPAPSSFKTLLQTSAYQYLFNTALPRHFLQLWTFANGTQSDPPALSITAAQLAAEYTEVYDAAVYLLQTYSNKEFIFKNWEGDWQLLNGFNPLTNVPSYRAERFTAFWGARQRAVRDARATTLSTSTVKYCVELNRCLDDHGIRVHRDILPHVKPDMVGWSAYEAINYWYEGWLRSAPTSMLTGNVNALATDGAGNYVAVADGGEISWSQDGKRWYLMPSGFSGSNVKGVAWDAVHGQFIAVGAGGKIATSPTGAVWTQQTSGTANQLNGVLVKDTGVIWAYGNAATLLYSFDGVSWSPVTYSGGAPAGPPDWICGDVSFSAGIFVVAGTDGKAVYGSSSIAVQTALGFGSSTVRVVRAQQDGGSGFFVAGGDGGNISLSNYGGSSWVSKTSQFGADAILDIARGQGLWVAVGTSGKISTSPDGDTWTARTAGTGAYLRCVTYSSTENAWAYGCDGATGYSLDGTDWIVNGQGATGGAIIYHMLSANGVTLTGSNSGLITYAKYWHPQRNAAANCDFYLRKGIARIRDAVPKGTPVAITEFGFPQEQSNFTGTGLDVGGLIQQVIDTATALNVAGIIYWQIFDNEEQSPGVPRGFSLYSRNGNATTPGPLNGAGQKFDSILS